MSASMKEAFRRAPPSKPVAALTPVGRLGHPSAAFLASISLQTVIAEVVEVTPALARQWLNDCNDHNRRVRLAHVRNLADDLRNDSWTVTHQGIAFSRDGRLIDGQHRLRAIIEAKKSALLTVFVDMDDAMFGALDRGVRRSISDELMQDRRFVDPCNWLVQVLKNSAPKPAEVRSVLEDYKPMLVAIHEAAGASAKGLTSAPIKAALMVRLRSASETQRKLLLDQWTAFVTTNVTEMDETIGALFRRLNRMQSNGSGGSAANERCAVAWIAFNPLVRNLRKITIRDVGHEMSEFRRAVAGQLLPDDQPAGVGRRP